MNARFADGPLPLGFAWFCVVRKLSPTVRTRHFFSAPAEMKHAEASEAEAFAVWKRIEG